MSRNNIQHSQIDGVYSKDEVDALLGLAPGGDTVVRRVATIVVSAADTLNKEQSDVILTGANDQVAIQAAIDAHRGAPALFLYRGGQYRPSDHIFTTSWHTHKAESIGKWKLYSGAGGYHIFPRSSPGTPGMAGGAQFVPQTPGKGVFRTQENYFPGESRHKDIVYSGLSFWGPSGTGVCIQDAKPTDFCKIEDCFISGFQSAIDIAWDNGIIDGNNIQDTGGTSGFDCVRTRGYRDKILNNTIFQVGGNGMRIGSVGATVMGNTIGATNELGVLITCARVKFIGNHVMAWGLGNVNGGQGGVVVGNFQNGNLMDLDARGVVIADNTIQKTGDYEDDPIANVGIGGGNCITLGAGSDGNPQGGPHSNTDYIVVSGNHCLTNQLTPGRAIQLDGNSNYCSITGNTVMGPFNNNTMGAINLGGGVGNKTRGNTGLLVGADAG